MTGDALISNLTRLIDERVTAALKRTEAERTKYLSTVEAAEYLNVPVSRMYDLVAQGRVQPYRDGTRLKFTVEMLNGALRR